jgi:hypothetical protein
VLVVWHPLLYQEPTDVQYHEVRTKEVLYSYVEGIERYLPPNDWQVCALPTEREREREREMHTHVCTHTHTHISLQ